MADLKLLLRLDALDKATKPLRNLQGAIMDTSQAAAAQRKRLLELQQTINNAPASRAQFEQMQKMRREMDLTTKAIARQERQIKLWARTRDARSSGKQMMMNGSMQLAGAGAVAYGVNSFMQDGEQFDVTMSRVQALARLDKDSETLKALREQAKHLGATTWADPTQVAEGQAFYAMAGFTPNKIMDAMAGTLNLARAGDVDIGRAADIGSNILSAFGLDAGQMDRVGDILVGTFTRTNTNLEMLGETMKYVGPIAKGLGISLEEASAMTGILGNVGIQGGEAGTAMRAIFSRLAAGPSMAKKELAKMGIKTTDTRGNLRKPMELLTEMLNKTAKMGNTDRLKALTSIAGLEAASALSALIDKGSVNDLQKIMKELEKNNGESKKLAKVMADNLAGDKQQFTSALTDWKITVQEVNNAGLRDLVQNMTKVMQTIGDWTKANPELISNLSKITGSAIAITAAIGSITMAMGFLKFAVIGHPIIALLTLVLFLGMQIYDNFDTIMWMWNEGFAHLHSDISDLLSKTPIIGETLKQIWDGNSPQWIIDIVAIATLASTIGLMTASFYKFWGLAKASKMLALSASFTKITWSIAGVTTALKGMSIALISSPLFVFANIAFALYAIIKNADKFFWLWRDGFAFMQWEVDSFLRQFGFWGNQLANLWLIMTNGLGAIKSLVEHVFTDWDGTILKLQGHWDDLTMNAQRFWNDFKAVGAPIIDWFSSAIEVIMNGLKGIINIYDNIVGKTNTEMYDRMGIAGKTGLTFSEFNNLPELSQLQAMGVNQPFQPMDIPVPSGPRLPPPLAPTESSQTMHQTNTIIVNGSGDPKSTADSVMDALKQSTDGSAKLWDTN